MSNTFNVLGYQLAEKVADGHQVAIYTHTDKDHIHNHLVINSVNMDTGLKFQAHGQKAIQEVKDANDQICLEHGLTIPEEPAKVRYSTAEKSLLEKGKSSWKDEIREVVDQARGRSTPPPPFFQIPNFFQKFSNANARQNCKQF
ncbi:relaxase/mobilization nuclease domain-containing protein [Enterococcus faecalis]|uniref:relaxase/mobilization nuclease domain-containing protein n=1 Tax=Enterococcus faecalis TaxID=1351 RepID=UPI000A218AAC|nr:relaxase/mobilization nuclease domain-containing protein [Enterococcus faecalis]OSH24174.1 rlx protein [Enterococcus faecalis]